MSHEDRTALDDAFGRALFCAHCLGRVTYREGRGGRRQSGTAAAGPYSVARFLMSGGDTLQRETGASALSRFHAPHHHQAPQN